jgi:hypothetical protein
MMTWLSRRIRRWSAHVPEEELLSLLASHPRAAGAAHPSNASAQQHVQTCERCTARLRELGAFLDNVTAQHDAAFEEAFPSDSLAHQRQAIRRRIEHATTKTTAARLLRFPAAARPALAGVPAQWWLGAAAAAGLVLGIAAGQLIHVHPVNSQAEITTTSANVTPITAPAGDATLPASGPASLTGTDDEAFMEQVEAVLVDPQISELSALDAITPRIREVALSPW